MPSLESLRFAQEEDGGVVGAFHRAVEAAREAPGKSTWACRAGCAFCCYLPVTVTPAEAEAIAPRVRDWSAVEAFAGGRCALLSDDDRCTVYDVRPLKCRAHTSVSADDCRDGNELAMDGWLVKAIEAIRLGLGGEPKELHAALLEVRRSSGS